MKITFILTDFPTYSQTFILQQIKNIIDAGHELKILANRNPNQSFVQPIFQKYRLDRITSYYKDSIFDGNSTLPDLKDLIEPDSDIFHCHFLPTGIALYRVINELNINKKILITCYGVDIMTRTKKNELIYLNSDNVSFIAVSDAIKERMIYLGIRPEKIWIVPLTVDVNYFKYFNKNKGSTTRFISVCRLVEKKGLDSAIKAFYTLFQSHPESKFEYAIYGDGPELENLKQLVSDLNLKNRIIINPPVDHKKILKLFKKSDFLIQTSRTAINGDGEGLPTVVLEAQAVGLPVIGTYHSRIPEEVIDAKTGFLAYEDNVSEIAENIYKSIKLTNTQYRKMAVEATRLMRNKFDDKRISKIMARLYIKIFDNTSLSNENERSESIKSLLSRPKSYLKVLFFNHTAGLGGSERSLLELIDELKEFQVIPKLVLPYEGDLSNELKKRGVDYEIVNYHWWSTNEPIDKKEKARRMIESFNNLLLKKRNLDKFKPDIIFTNTLTIPWGAFYAIFTGKPHMTFIREFGNMDFGFDFFYGFDESIKFINDYSNYTFTNSKATLNHFKRYLNSKRSDYAYAYIKIDKRLLNQKVKKIFFKSDSLKLAILGAIIPTKGQEETVRAVSELIKKGLNVELAIIGKWHDQKFFDRINKIIKASSTEGKIKFHNFTVNPYSYMKQADVLIVSSRNEAYGRVTIEAMALGKPVVGTDSGATHEIIKDGITGLLYKPGNHKELAEKIEILYNNRRKINTLGKNAFHYYKKTFSKRIYGMKVLKQLKRIKMIGLKDNALSLLLRDLSNSMIGELSKKDQAIANLKIYQEQLVREKEQLNEEKQRLNSKLSSIYSSKTWKILFFYKKLTNAINKLIFKRSDP